MSMREPTKYTIVECPWGISGLAITVEVYIEDGWKPQGGVFALPRQPETNEAKTGTYYSYMQAMVRDED